MSDRSWGGGYDNNPYYHPENCGLTTVAQLEDDEPWQYHTVILVKDNFSGAYYAACDSGCSCPTPFESVTGLGDMTRIDNLAAMEDFIRSQNGPWRASDTLDFMRKAREALPK